MPIKDIYERVFEASPQARLVIAQDRNGGLHVTHANAAASEYFGVERDVFFKNQLDQFLDIGNKAHILQAIKVCFSSGISVDVQVTPVLPGSIRIQSFTLNPVLDDAGKVVAIDMVARPPASDEDALRRERDDAMSIYASVFDASDVGIMITDHNRRIVRVNETLCRIYGWDPIDLIGYEFTILIPPEEHDIARRRHDDLLGTEFKEKSRELKVLKKSGELANILASSGVIELSGKRKFRISTLVDITHLKKIERDLRKAKEIADASLQAKSMFLANMSHELRTPLNAIIGFSDLMITGTLGPIGNTHYQEYLGDIRFSASHLLSIINDVLDMSKIEAGQMNLNYQTSDIVPIIEEVTRLMRVKASESKVTLELDVANALAPVKVDQRMIRQVLLNLISNALKFSHAGGKVRLGVRIDGQDWLVMDVCDDGVGIPADKMDEVMQPFGQVVDARFAAGQGTGLGLPLARAMMELHGGTLSLESQVDKGTTVTCRLPLAAA